MAIKHAYYMYRHNRAFTLHLVIMKIRFNKKRNMLNHTSWSCDFVCAWLMWKHILQILLKKSVEKFMLLAEHIKVGCPFRRSSLLKPLVRLTSIRQTTVQCSKLSYTVCLSMYWRIGVLLHWYNFILYYYNNPPKMQFVERW